MNLCCTNQIVVAVLPERKNYTISQIMTDWPDLMENKQTSTRNSFSFTSQGKLTSWVQAPSTSFTIFKNEILKEINIKKRTNLSTISKVLLPNQSEKLSKGTTIKLGNNIIQIYDIYPLEEHNPQKKQQNEKSFQKTQRNEGEKIKCRICFGESQTLQDPLLNFCKCSGSVKFMHLECYREWFIKKVRIRPGQKITHFQYSNIKCDLCKETMPFTVQKNKIKYSLVDYKKEYKSQRLQRQAYNGFMQYPEQFSEDSSINFIGMEENIYYDDSRFFSNNSFQQEISEDMKKQSYCLVLKIDTMNPDNVKNQEIILLKMYPEQRNTLGTNFSCRVVFNSPSISPEHAVIYLKDKNIFIEDSDSDFGTFVTLEKKKDYDFECKEGLLLEHNNGHFVYLRKKTGFLSFFQSNIRYTLKFD